MGAIFDKECDCCRTRTDELFATQLDNKETVRLCAYCYESCVGAWNEYPRNHRGELPLGIVIASCFNILERRLKAALEEQVKSIEKREQE